VLRFSLALLCSVAAMPSLAQQGDAAAEDGTIVVLAPEYAEGRITSATKIETPLVDVPQAVTVVTRDLIDDLNIRSMTDLVRFTPGVSSGQGEGHRDQITIRGQNTTADFFVDGVRDDVQYFRSFYNVDRVEVLKGPNAMIFGRGGGGGVINRVTKAPNADLAFNAFAGSVDTFGSAFIEGDVNAPLGDALALRLNAFYERLDNHRDAFDGDRFGLNPTALVTLGEATSILFSYEYVDDNRVVDRGVPAARVGTIADPARPVRGFRDAFFGIRGLNETDFNAHVVKLTTTHRFSDAVSLSNKLSYGDYDKVYSNVFPATPVQTNGTLGIEAYIDPTNRSNLFSQTDLVVTAATGGIEHTILVGNEIGFQDTTNARLNGFFGTATRVFVPFTDPIAIPTPTFRTIRAVDSDADVLAFYLQDQVALGAHFEIVAGIRFDSFDVKVTNLLSGQSFDRRDELWSPRLGLVWKPAEAMSAYASYSRSYLPQSGDQFLSLDLTAAALKPEKFENYELGFKWDVREDLSFTAAVYQLDRSNTRAPGATPGTVVLTGEQRSKGLELGLNGRLTPAWRVSAGYALQESEIRRTTAAAPAGRDVAQVPKHQLSLWNHYDFDDRIGVGIGLYHQAKSFASISNAVVLPSYTRVDAAAFFKISDNLEAQLNVENLLGETYFPTAHNDSNISTGAPRSARLTLRTRF
jgi:catecholate siderophore receptor